MAVGVIPEGIGGRWPSRGVVMHPGPSAMIDKGLPRRRMKPMACSCHAHGDIMGHARPASKRPTNVSLDEELVRTARLLTSNLSGTLEELLREFVTREQTRRRAQDDAVAEVTDSLNAFHRTHGLLSDEFSSL